jgi:hypothetical protein
MTNDLKADIMCFIFFLARSDIMHDAGDAKEPCRPRGGANLLLVSLA